MLLSNSKVSKTRWLFSPWENVCMYMYSPGFVIAAGEKKGGAMRLTFSEFFGRLAVIIVIYYQRVRKYFVIKCYSSTICMWQRRFLPSFASGFEFLMKAENLAKISIPAVFDSGCLAPSLMYLHIKYMETSGWSVFGNDGTESPQTKS